MLSGRLDDPRPSRDGEDVLVADRVLRGGDVLRRTRSGVAEGRGWRERASPGPGECGEEREGVERCGEVWRGGGVEVCVCVCVCVAWAVPDGGVGVERERCGEVWRGVWRCVCVAWGGAWSETIFFR